MNDLAGHGLPRAIVGGPAMCAACPNPSKRRYATVEAARREATGLLFIADGLVMRAYRCPCGMWHLTRRHAAPLPAGLPGERLG